MQFTYKMNYFTDVKEEKWAYRSFLLLHGINTEIKGQEFASV